MSKWNKYTVKSEKVKIDDELEITVRGLSFLEAGELAKYQERNDRSGLVKFLVTRTFEKAPEFEDKGLIPEVVENLDMNTGAKIIEAVFRVSGIEVDEAKKDAIEKLKK